MGPSGSYLTAPFFFSFFFLNYYLVNQVKKLFILLITVGCVIFHTVLIMEFSQLNFINIQRLTALLISMTTIHITFDVNENR